MRIGNLEIENRGLLAPMAGVTDSAFRRICMQMGAGLCYTEMISAKGLIYGGDGSAALLKYTPEERPIGVQLFGREPQRIAQAVERVGELGFALIDLNMGCPAKKIVGNGEGSALMREMDVAHAVLQAAVRAAGRLPVTVKFRAGWDEENRNAVAFARMAEQAGVAAVCIHGRTRVQFYAGRADWEMIARVKAAVKIPVIGNGDVTDGESARAMLAQTRCDAVMVGRGAQGNPWIFRQIACALSGQAAPMPPSAGERIEKCMEQAAIMVREKGERTALREMRKHAAWYIKGLRGAAAVRGKINAVETLAQLDGILRQCLDAGDK